MFQKTMFSYYLLFVLKSLSAKWRICGVLIYNPLNCFSDSSSKFISSLLHCILAYVFLSQWQKEGSGGRRVSCGMAGLFALKDKWNRSTDFNPSLLRKSEVTTVDVFFVVCFCPIYYPITGMLWTSATGHCRGRRRQQIIWGLACTSCQGPQLCCLNSRELPWIPWVKFPFHHPDRCLAMPSPRPNRFTEISFRKIKTLEKAARLALFEAFVWGKMHIIRRVHIH